jgi:hypothetical protein
MSKLLLLVLLIGTSTDVNSYKTKRVCEDITSKSGTKEVCKRVLVKEEKKEQKDNK